MKEIKFPIETGIFYDEEDERLIRSREEDDWQSVPEPERSAMIREAKAAAKPHLPSHPTSTDTRP